MFLDAFRTNSSNIVGRNPSMVIPVLANQDLTPMLIMAASTIFSCVYTGLLKGSV